MIAKSDLVILTISSLALVAGVYRWQENVAVPSIAVAPAASTRVAERTPVDVVRPGRDASATVAGSLADDADGVSRSVADPALTVRRVDTDEATGSSRPAGRDTATSAARTTDPALPRAGASAGNVTPDVVASATDDTDRALYGVYRVRSGDYLGKIAARFGTSVASLQRINGIEGSRIEVGEEIRYPQPAN